MVTTTEPLNDDSYNLVGDMENGGGNGADREDEAAAAIPVPGSPSPGRKGLVTDEFNQRASQRVRSTASLARGMANLGAESKCSSSSVYSRYSEAGEDEGADDCDDDGLDELPA
jgi:hypothetical protein